MGNPKKTEREDGQCSAGLVLSFRKGIETRNERQTSTNRSDSKPQKSRLFSVLCGLKDGVHLMLSHRRQPLGFHIARFLKNSVLYLSENMPVC